MAYCVRSRHERSRPSVSPAPFSSASSHGRNSVTPSRYADRSDLQALPQRSNVVPASDEEDQKPGAPVFFCPSAQPDVQNGLVFGVVGGTPGDPRVSYLESPLPVTPELLGLSELVHPTEVFRFGAPCAQSGCQHYDGSHCGLIPANRGRHSTGDRATDPLAGNGSRCCTWCRYSPQALSARRRNSVASRRLSYLGEGTMAVLMSLAGNSSGDGFLIAPRGTTYDAELALSTDAGLHPSPFRLHPTPPVWCSRSLRSTSPPPQ